MNFTKVKNICKASLGVALSALILCSPVMAYAQSDAVLPSGLSASEAQTVLEDIINSEMQITVTGGTVRLSVGGEMVYSGNYGQADVENSIIVDENTVFEWGTASHLLIWVTVLQLAEDGMIDLDTDITNYLPEGDLKEEFDGKGVTLMHLMNYSSGYHDSFSEKSVPQGSAYASLEETLINNMPKQTYAAGNVVALSDWSAALAAYIVEYVSGVSYADYVKENIFTPLAMEKTALLPDLSDNETVMNARKEVKSYSGNIALANNFYHVPLYTAGMVTGTADDFHKFAAELLVQDGSSKLFDKAETAEG